MVTFPSKPNKTTTLKTLKKYYIVSTALLEVNIKRLTGENTMSTWYATSDYVVCVDHAR